MEGVGRRSLAITIIVVSALGLHILFTWEHTEEPALILRMEFEPGFHKSKSIIAPAKHMKKNYLVFLTALLVFSFPCRFASQCQAGASDAYDLITKVNGLRTANGLPALEIDSHPDEHRAIHRRVYGRHAVCAHMGGVRERVIAAGYGGSGTALPREHSCGPQNHRPGRL
jgi:hypothetical protein